MLTENVRTYELSLSNLTSTVKVNKMKNNNIFYVLGGSFVVISMVLLWYKLLILSVLVSLLPIILPKPENSKTTAIK